MRGLFILERGQDNYLFLFELRGRLQNELESRVGGREESGFVFDGRTVSSVEMEGDECFADGYAEFPVEHTGGLVGFEHKRIGGLGDWGIGGLGDWEGWEGWESWELWEGWERWEDSRGRQSRGRDELRATEARYGGALRGRATGAHTTCEGGVGSKIWESEGRGYFLPGGGGIAVESAGAKCAYGTSEIVDSAFLQVSILGKGILVP